MELGVSSWLILPAQATARVRQKNTSMQIEVTERKRIVGKVFRKGERV
jgi:hypothetical protein